MKSTAYRASIRQRLSSLDAGLSKSNGLQLNYNDDAHVAGSGAVTIAQSSITSATITKLTISFFFKWLGPNPGANNFVFGSTDDGVGASDGYFAMFLDSRRIAWYVSGLNKGREYQPASGFWSNWHHVVFVYDGTESTADDRTRIYVDGSEVSTSSIGTPAASISRPDDPFHLGAPGGFEGSGLVPHAMYKMVALWEDAATAAEVTTLYNSGVALDPTTVTTIENLKFVWPAGETRIGDVDSNGGQITDISGAGNHGACVQSTATFVQFVEDTGYPR